MPCARCHADPRRIVPGAASDRPRYLERQCGFDGRGVFVVGNWCCLTLETLSRVAPAVDAGRTTALYVIPCDPTSDGGWIALTTHGWKHQMTSAVHLGDHAARVLSLGVAETALAYWAERHVIEQAAREARRLDQDPRSRVGVRRG